nr:hypothetical protein [uncultured Tateyamaria sp.]
MLGAFIHQRIKQNSLIQHRTVKLRAQLSQKEDADRGAVHPANFNHFGGHEQEVIKCPAGEYIQQITQWLPTQSVRPLFHCSHVPATKLPEMVTESAADYRKKLIGLVRDQKELSLLRSVISGNRCKLPRNASTAGV